MNITTISHSRLTVVDRRSRFATVALVWRTCAGSEADVGRRLRETVSSATGLTATGLEPVWTDWTASDGAQCLTAILPEAVTRSWIETVIHTVRSEVQGVAGHPALAVVGSAGVVEKVDEISAVLGGELSPPSHEALPSTMRQSTSQGFEETLVIGQDPSPNVGFAATFLGICLIAGGPGTLLPDAVQRSGYEALLQVSRGLQDSKPTVTWQVIARRPQGLAVLELALSTMANFRAAEYGDAVEQARKFALANLNRAWRSPVELARSLANYEAMGWGGELIRNPEAAFAELEPRAIEQAVQGLVLPVKEILGRT